MNDLNELSLLTLFFYTLGLATLVIIGLRKALLYWIGIHALVVAVLVWFLEFKWILLGGIGFMLVASYYALWYFYGEHKRICTMRESHDDEQGENNARNG